MKKSYETPTLHVHGAVEVLTARFGDPAQSDAIFFGGQQIGSAQGSIDACATVNANDCL